MSGLLPTSVRHRWDRDRWSIVVVEIGSVIATVVWEATTRPMGDSPSYRDAGLILSEGWSTLTERTPGYPALLWWTRSLHWETTQLFLMQLLFHAVAVLLAVRVAARIGMPSGWRVVVAVLLMMPAPMVKVVYAGTEALAELLVVLALWTFARWYDRRSDGLLLALGCVLGALTWVRPTFQLAFVPAGLMVWWCVRRRSGREALRKLAAVTVPAMSIVAVLVVSNGVRFDSWGTTSGFGWFLGSRTSAFVQELPKNVEPVRTALIEERDRRLLLGPGTDAENYQFGMRDELARLTGLSGTDLDAYVLDLNASLIVHHPLEYVDAVMTSGLKYVQIDAEPAASGPGRVGGWIQNVVHLGLMLGFLVPLLLLPGLVWRGDCDPRVMTIIGFGLALSLYVAVVSCMVETGSSRLRAPTDALLVLAMVTGWWTLVRVRTTARRQSTLHVADPSSP